MKGRRPYGKGWRALDNKEFVLATMRSFGSGAAENLRQRASSGEADGTAIIAEEHFVPEWSPKSFLDIPLGSPYQHDGQVWTLLQPYDGTIYKDPPAKMRAQWGLCHTKDPSKAKPFVDPLGTSGLYYRGECCTDPLHINPETVFRLKVDKTDHRPSAYPQVWEEVAAYD